MNQIIPITLILLAITAGIIVLIISKRNKYQIKQKPSPTQTTANEFINVVDIKDRFLYTRDGQIIVYIKINPISIDLFSDAEKEQMCRALTAEISSMQKPFYSLQYQDQ